MCMYLCVWFYMYVCTHILVYSSLCVYKYMCVYMCVYMYMTHTYIVSTQLMPTMASGNRVWKEIRSCLLCENHTLPHFLGKASDVCGTVELESF